MVVLLLEILLEAVEIISNLLELVTGDYIAIDQEPVEKEATDEPSNGPPETDAD